MNKERLEIFEEVDKKCNEMVEYWTKKKINDDGLQAFSFVRNITRQTNSAIRQPFDAYGFRKFMIQAAAFAMLAVEWADRREKNEGNFRSY